MMIISRLVAFTASLLVVIATTRVTLAANLRRGVYPINADSIGIPLAETATLSLLGAALLVALVALPVLIRKTATSRPWLVTLSGALVLTYLCAGAFFTLWGLSWLTPHHYFIAASCGLAVGVILFFAVADYRSLRPNNSFKPKPLRGSA